MPTLDLGRVRPVPQGAWSNTLAYLQLDIVSDSGGSYIALQDVPAGTALSNAAYWQALALKGDPGPGLTDGDKGDITVASGVWSIDPGVVTLAKMANMASASLFYRKTAGAGAPEVQSLATLKADLGLTGTNSGDQTITLTGDVTGSGTGSFAATIGAGAVTLSKMANLATSTILGRSTAGSGAPEALTPAQVRTLLNVADGANAYVHPNHSGDVTSTGDGATTIAAGAVTNAKLANMPTASLKGRASAGSGAVEDLTPAQATALLDLFSAVLKGLVPASGGGTTNFLRADGTWAAPPGGGGGLTDGDYGDIIVSVGGTVLSIDPALWTGARTIAGNWTFGDGTSATDLFINGAGGTARSMWFRTAGSNRWRFYVNTTAESGSNAGSNLGLNAYSDSGTLLGSVLTVNRASQVVDFEQTPTVQGVAISAPPVLGLWDYWYQVNFSVTGATAPDMFGGVAISSGTNTTAPAAASMQGYNPFGVLLRSSTTANSGYTYRSTQMTNLLFGTASVKYRSQLVLPATLATRTIRAGLLDTTSSADAVDGAYFEIADNVISCKTASNSTRTTAGTTYTLAAQTPATLEIDVNDAGTSARFRVWTGTNETPVLDQTITTNIPTGSARAMGAGIIATSSGTTAADLCVMHAMGLGTIAAFQRATGRS